MKKFKYKARKSPTEVVEGLLDANSMDAAIDQINQMGYLPIDLDEVKAEAATVKKAAAVASPKKKSGKVKPRNVTAFYKQLSRLVKSGVPLLTGFGLLAQQSENESFRAVLLEIQNEIRQGSTLSQSLGQYKQYFSVFDLSMIQAGESVGQLDEALKRIAAHREAQEELSSKVRSAMAYPAFMGVAGFGTVAFMIAVVIPRFADFFKDLGQELPFITRMLMAISGFMESFWLVFVAIAVVGFFLFKRGLADPNFKKSVDGFLLGLPKVGPVLVMSEISKFSRTLQLLITSGIQLTQALRIAVPVIGNTAMRSDLDKSHQVLEEGGHLSEALSDSKYFPLFVNQLVRIGEESGHLDSTLGDIADWYDQETGESIKVMTQFLEPIMMLAIGLVLGFIIVAVLLPVFSMDAMIS